MIFFFELLVVFEVSCVDGRPYKTAVYPVGGTTLADDDDANETESKPHKKFRYFET